MAQLGIVTYNIAKDWDLPTILSRLEKLGYEGVELRTTHAHKVEVNLSKQQRDEVVPTRKFVAEQNLLRYNASLISVFDLLTDARGQIASVDDYIRSVRDFWMAKSELDTALIGNSLP